MIYLKNMIDENNILDYIKISSFIEISLKKNLLKDFDKLNQKQKQMLVNYFNNQKNEILKMLMSLKDNEICTFEEIQTSVYAIHKKLINSEELQDMQKDEEEIYNLLDSIV